MRELAILTFVTLDGVMQGPNNPDEDRTGGFDQGGWAKPFWDEVMAQVKDVAMKEPYDFLYGHKTFDIFSAHCQPEDPDNHTVKTINQSQKYVVSSQNDELGWSDTHRIQSEIPKEIAKLKAMDGKLLQVHGSCELIQLILANDLVDELRLWTFPVILGAGKRLFGDGTVPGNFKLVKTDSTPGGVIMSIYRRAG